VRVLFLPLRQVECNVTAHVEEEKGAVIVAIPSKEQGLCEHAHDDTRGHGIATVIE